ARHADLRRGLGPGRTRRPCRRRAGPVLGVQLHALRGRPRRRAPGNAAGEAPRVRRRGRGRGHRTVHGADEQRPVRGPPARRHAAAPRPGDPRHDRIRHQRLHAAGGATHRRVHEGHRQPAGAEGRAVMSSEIGLLGPLLGGVLLLLSPCSALLLPPFFSYGFDSSVGRLAGRTAVFYLGLATVMVPLGAGVGAFSSLVTRYRSTAAIVGGIVLIVLGVAIIVGK